MAIVAIDNNWAIGKKGRLLTHLPNDLKRFKELTRESIVIMGRKTLESLPNGKPLSLRDNIILTKNNSFKVKNAMVIYSIADVMTYTYKIMKEGHQSIFVIGGESIYQQFLRFCSQVYVTKINHSFKNTDTFFPNLDQLKNWKVYKGEIIKERGFTYQYLRYVRK